MRSLLLFVAASCRSEAIAAVTTVGILIAALPAFAVDPTQPFSGYIRTHFTADDGLPASVGDDIQQTPDGFRWLIVNGSALVRFDGRQFHEFEGIVAVSLAVRSNGDLLIGTMEHLR